MLELLRWGLIGTATLSVAMMVGLLSTVSPIERAKYGYRGAERMRAVEAGGFFATFEPMIRYIAALIGQLPLTKLRVTQQRDLQRADDVLGLQPDELSALSLLSCLLLGFSVHIMVRTTNAPCWLVLVALVFGLALPTFQVREVCRLRSKTITRALPPAIEIAAMCMGAGLDFPGALRMLVDKGNSRASPLSREFAVILEHLEFGHTRRLALEGFADRVPNRAVKDFVHAVIQSEQKGNPLARVLQIQGRMLNMRRSVLAEEAAARAAVLLIVPMVLLLGAILLLLMGPFMVKGIGW